MLILCLLFHPIINTVDMKYDVKAFVNSFVLSNIVPTTRVFESKIEVRRVYIPSVSIWYQRLSKTCKTTCVIFTTTFCRKLDKTGRTGTKKCEKGGKDCVCNQWSCSL